MLLTAPISPRLVYGPLSVVAPVLPPLGLCSLGAVLRSAGHQVRIIDASAGRYIYLGVESGSRRIRELLGRRQNLALIERAVCAIQRAGVFAYGSFMLGIPTETRAEMKDTRRVALKLGLDGVFIFQYTPYPGTRLRELARREGEVSSSWEDYSAHPTTAAFRSNYLSPAEVKKYIMGTYLRFFLRPRMQNQ